MIYSQRFLDRASSGELWGNEERGSHQHPTTRLAHACTPTIISLSALWPGGVPEGHGAGKGPSWVPCFPTCLRASLFAVKVEPAHGVGRDRQQRAPGHLVLDLRLCASWAP